MIDALIRAYRLKDEVRTGWLLRGVSRPESVADHSWGTACLALLYAGEAGVDRSHAVEMAVVHDLAEAVTGDVATRVVSMGDSDLKRRKAERERAAMDLLCREFGPGRAERTRALWDEYEQAATREALFVRDMNLIDMCLQALIYESSCRSARARGAEPDAGAADQYAGLEEFFATSEPRLSTDLGRRLFAELSSRYAEVLPGAGRGFPG